MAVAAFVRECKGVSQLVRDSRGAAGVSGDALADVHDALRRLEYTAADLRRGADVLRQHEEAGNLRTAHAYSVAVFNDVRGLHAAAAAAAAVTPAHLRRALELRCLACSVVEHAAGWCNNATLYEAASCWGRMAALWEVQGAVEDARTCFGRALHCAGVAGGAAGAAAALPGGKARDAVECQLQWAIATARLEWPAVEGDAAAAAAPPATVKGEDAAHAALTAAAAALPFFDDDADDAAAAGAADGAGIGQAFADAVASRLLTGATLLMAQHSWARAAVWLRSAYDVLGRPASTSTAPAVPGDARGNTAEWTALSLAFATLEARAPMLATASASFVAAATDAIAALVPPTKVDTPVARYIVARCYQLQRALPAARGATLRLIDACDGDAPHHFALALHACACQADACDASDDCGALYVAAARRFTAPAAIAALRIDYITRLVAVHRAGSDRATLARCVARVMEDHAAGRVPLTDAEQVRQLVRVLQRLRGLDVARGAWDSLAVWAEYELALTAGTPDATPGGIATLHLTAALAQLDAGAGAAALAHAAAATAAVDSVEARLLAVRIWMRAGDALPAPLAGRRAALAALLAHAACGAPHCLAAMDDINVVRARSDSDAGAYSAMLLEVLRVQARTLTADGGTPTGALQLAVVYTQNSVAAAGGTSLADLPLSTLVELADLIARCAAAAVACAPAAGASLAHGSDAPLSRALLTTVTALAASLAAPLHQRAAADGAGEAARGGTAAAAMRAWMAVGNLAQLLGATDDGNGGAPAVLRAAAALLATECAVGAGVGALVNATPAPADAALAAARAQLDAAATAAAAVAALPPAHAATPLEDSADGSTVGVVRMVLRRLHGGGAAPCGAGAESLSSHAARLAAAHAVCTLLVAALAHGVSRATRSTPPLSMAAATDALLAALSRAHAWPLDAVVAAAGTLAQPVVHAAPQAVKLLLAALAHEVEVRRVHHRRRAAAAAESVGSASATTPSAAAAAAAAAAGDLPGATLAQVATVALAAWDVAAPHSSDRHSVLTRVRELVEGAILASSRDAAACDGDSGGGDGASASAAAAATAAAAAAAAMAALFPLAPLDALVVAAWNDGKALARLRLYAAAEKFMGWCVSMLDAVTACAQGAVLTDRGAGAAVHSVTPDALRLRSQALALAHTMQREHADLVARVREVRGGEPPWTPWAAALGAAAGTPPPPPPPPLSRAAADAPSRDSKRRRTGSDDHGSGHGEA